jgi:[acyl-carrier-protein] S-malonyltransferase
VKARIPLVSNVDAEPIVHPDDLRRELVSQITSAVQWIRVVETMAELGVKQYWEIGPGSVLSGLITRIDKSARTHQAEKALAAQMTGIGE